MIKRIMGLLMCLCFAVFTMFQTASNAYASGVTGKTEQTAAKVRTAAEQLAEISAPSYILTEMQTGTVLFEKESGKQFRSAHFNKLMTLLLLAQKIQSGEVKTSDMFTVTDRANAQNDPQIWLDIGEKISVDELIKAVTVGNANDAAVTIAENVCSAESKFVLKMNEQAKKLGMVGTVFVDSTGTGEGNMTTSRDISALCKALAEYDFLTSYFKTWIVNVRGNKAELVNSNRLVRTYKGLTGMKAFSSKQCGSCACVTADKSGMQLCAVVLGDADNDKRDEDIKKLLKCGAESFQLYSPQVPDELLNSIAVTGGESLECELEVRCKPLVIIKRGTAKDLVSKSYAAEKLKAPVSKGQICAQYSLEYEKSTVCTVDIIAKREIKEMNWLCGVKKLLYNLIEL